MFAVDTLVSEMPLTPPLSPSEGERVAEGRVRGFCNAATFNNPLELTTKLFRASVNFTSWIESAFVWNEKSIPRTARFFQLDNS